MSAAPRGVSSPGATPHSGHGSAEYRLRRALSQVGARTPWRLTITTYFSRSAAGSGCQANSADKTIAESQLVLTIETIPEARGEIGFVEFALIDENRAALIVAEHLVGEVQTVNHRGESVSQPDPGLRV